MKPINKIKIHVDCMEISPFNGISIICEGLDPKEILDAIELEAIFKYLSERREGKETAMTHWNLEEVKKSKEDYYLLQLTKEILSRDVSPAIKLEALEEAVRLVENNKVGKTRPSFYLVGSFDWKETKVGREFWRYLYDAPLLKKKKEG